VACFWARASERGWTAGPEFITRRQVITGALLISIIWTLLHAYVWARLFDTLPTTMDAALPVVLAAWQPASMILMLLLALLPFVAGLHLVEAG